MSKVFGLKMFPEWPGRPTGIRQAAVQAIEHGMNQQFLLWKSKRFAFFEDLPSLRNRRWCALSSVDRFECNGNELPGILVALESRPDR